MLRIALMTVALLTVSVAQATEAGWALLRNGSQVVLLNHANAPGSGDPANFDIDECRTQRNLSERGRQQARRIGALIAARAAPIDEILTSRYCRARDTAQLAFGADFEEVEFLDPFEVGSETAVQHQDALIERVSSFAGFGIMVLVTHGNYIEAVTGVRAREGEAIIVTPSEDGLSVAGRIAFN